MRMRGLCVGCLLLAAACDEPPPVATLTATPEKFVGTWDVSADDCRAGRGFSTVIISEHEVLFSDSQLTVNGALPDGANAARIDGHFKTEMAEWDGSIRLELADGGKTLNVVNGSTVAPRVKCS